MSYEEEDTWACMLNSPLYRVLVQFKYSDPINIMHKSDTGECLCLTARAAPPAANSGKSGKRPQKYFVVHSNTAFLWYIH